MRTSFPLSKEPNHRLVGVSREMINDGALQVKVENSDDRKSEILNKNISLFMKMFMDIVIIFYQYAVFLNDFCFGK